MDDWTHEQLAAAVDAYRWMQVRTAEGLKLNKTQLYRDLALKHGRTPKAWEYRMQNISHVLDKLKEDWIEGLKPAKNVGPEVTGALIKLLKVGPTSAVSPATLIRLEQQRQLVDESGYFLPENVEDQRNQALRSIVQRQGQREFRAALLEAYGSKCAMTGCDVVDVLEAAHIHRYMGKETNVVSNGLLLRADVHTLFDLFLIGVEPTTMQICVAPSLAASIYAQLKGRPLATPSCKRHLVDKSLIEKHRALCEW
ncbi:HNH endonuclease [uncultured Stenotrophomonas sp.]|uniref:HNH endonuclease n=1 Tax=uncultured Stenotrophomonas sp. TaxID=165438 RepID=UPI0028D13A42|nr:HNH endonuclease [uncultured Stenotrophomonas sp.]